MSSVKDLVIVEKVEPLEVFTPEGIEPLLNRITKDVKSFVLDVNTPAGRKDITSLAYKIAQSKTYLDGVGKDLVSEWKRKAESVDSIRRRAREHLDALKDEVKAPLVEWEAVEAERVAELKTRFESLMAMGETEGMDSGALSQRISEVETLPADDTWAEFQDEAIALKDRTLVDLKRKLESQKKIEEQQAEIDRLNAEKAQQEAQRRAEEQAAAEARRKEEEAKAKAEAERQELIRKNEEAERRAAEAEQRAKQAEEARANAEREAVEKAEREAKLRAEEQKRAEQRKAEEEERAQQAEEDRKARHKETVQGLANEMRYRTETMLQSFEEIAEWIVSEWKGGE